MLHDMERQQALHVVLGAGQIGNRVAQLLASAGHRVRQVRQRAQPSTIAGVELVAGDITDPAFATRVGQGAISGTGGELPSLATLKSSKRSKTNAPATYTTRLPSGATRKLWIRPLNVSSPVSGISGPPARFTR